MITKISKWFLYTASYLVLFPLLIIRIIFFVPEDASITYELVLNNIKQNIFLIILLIVMIVISALTLKLFDNFRPNIRHKKILQNNVTYEITAFIIPYIISLLTINTDLYGWIICISIYIGFGMLTLISEVIRLCPFYLFLGYKLYVDIDGKYVLTKLSKEQYNQLCMEEDNGLEARELTPKLVIVKRNKF